jgi:hypothetical protein
MIKRMLDWWYYTAAHRSCLARLVGVHKWGILTNEQKAGLVGDRAEYLAFVMLQQKISLQMSSRMQYAVMPKRSRLRWS